MHSGNKVVRAAWMAALAILAAPAFAPAVEPVISHIPDGAMGFVLINNVEKTLNGVEAFMKDIGQGKMFGPPPGAEADAPAITLLGMVRGLTKLGEGWTASGGVALVMLDPADLGIDTMELLGLSQAPPAEEGAAPKPKPLPPVVMLVAGNGVDKVFGAYEPKDDAGTWQMQIGPMPVFAMQVGGYIVASPNKDALALIGKAGKKPASGGMDPTALAVANRGDLVIHLNLVKIAPLIEKVMPMAQAGMKGSGSEKEMAAMMLGMYENLLKQLKSGTMSLRLTGDGVALETHVSGLPEAAWTKTVNSQVGVRGGVQLLNSLPSLPYGAALGAASAVNPANTAANLEMVDKLLKMQALEKVSDELKARMRKMVEDYSGQFTGAQAVIGGAPAQAGVFGVAYVVRCQDAEKASNVIPEGFALAEALLKALVTDKEIQDLKFVYTKGAATIGGQSVNTVEVQHPKIADADEKKKADAKKIFGEDKLLIRSAVVGKDQLVITFGGGEAMMAEALKVAGGKGPIPTAPGTAAALKHLPTNPNVVAVINVANILDIVRTGMTVMGTSPDEIKNVPTLKCQVPLSLGVQNVPNGIHGVFYVPTALVKDVIPVFQKMEADKAEARRKMREMQRGAEEGPGREKEVQKDGAAPASPE